MNTAISLQWPGCPVRIMKLTISDDAPPPSTPEATRALVDLLKMSEPLILTFESVSSEVGLQFWRKLPEVTPSLCYLDFNLVLQRVPDLTAYIVCIILTYVTPF